MTTAGVLQHFQCVKRAGPGKWMARCPAHVDRDPSLSISDSAGKTLLKCFAGCDTSEIVKRAGLSLQDLFADGAKPQRQIVATYDYTDESGALLYQVVRFDPKDFSQRRPDGKGGWIWKLGSTRRVIYRLPEVLKAKSVLILEGEKDADTGRKLGLTSTCNPQGAGKWKPEYSESLKGKRLVIIADADAPGVAHGRDVARSLVEVAESVRLIEALPQGKDLSEWIERGGSRERLLSLIKEVPELTAADVAKWKAAPHAPEHLAKLECFANIQPRSLRWVWRNRFPTGKLSLIVGDPDKGKSLITLDMAARITTGRPYPDGAPSERGSVIILSAEDDAEDTIRPRLDAAGADASRVHWLEAVRVVQRDGKQGERTFSLESDINALDDAIKQVPDVRVIFIDPISAYLGATESHKNAEVRGLLAPLKEFTARTGVTIVGVTHFRKSSGPAIHRSIDSIAFAAAARAVWGVAEDPKDADKRIMVRIKGNLSHDPGGLAYRTIEVGPDIPRIAWEPGVVNLRADDVLGGLDSREDSSERHEAAHWLREFLADGPKPMREVQKQAEQAGFSWATVLRAKAALGICPQKSGFRGVWEWSLPDDAQPPSSEDAQPQHAEVSIFSDTRMNKREDVIQPVEDAQPAQVSNFGSEGSTLPLTEVEI